MMVRFRDKLNSSGKLSRKAVLIIVIAAVVCAGVLVVPVMRAYNRYAQRVACDAAMDSARRQVADSTILTGEQSTVEEYKEVVAYSMNGWEDLCPSGGTPYIVEREINDLQYDVVCGLHDRDSKERTRLNAGYVLDQIRDGVRHFRNLEGSYPESLTVTFNGRDFVALLVDEPVDIKRGTKASIGYYDTVVFYSVVGHSEFGADSGEDEGTVWYFVFADDDHCAKWNSLEGWTGDSYES